MSDAVPVTLRAIGWDHPRCRAPMEAAAAAWDGDAIDWTYRPLAAFNAQPIEELASTCDLLVIDHPMIPAAAEAGCLVPLDARLKAPAMGRCQEAYAWRGRQWALAVDAACHVSCRRSDLLAARGLAPPATWDDVLELAAGAPGSIALPLMPDDAICALVSVAATLDEPLRLDAPMPRRAVALLLRLAAAAHQLSFEVAPPQLFEHLTLHDDVCFVPLTFGYSAYADPAPSGRRQLEFGSIPSATLWAGGILGGAGIAVSAAGSNPDAAAAFAAWVSSAEIQSTMVLESGGQPAARAAWNAPSAGAFFAQTRAAIENATLRPRDPAWPRIQRALGERLAGGLRAGEPSEELAASLDDVVAAQSVAEVLP